MPMLAPLQPMPTSFPQDDPAERIRKLLAAASPAAQAILSQSPASPDEQAGVDASIASDLAASPLHQAAQAIRDSIAAHPGSPGLNMPEYDSLQGDAQAQIRRWIGGAGSGVLPQVTRDPMNNSNISSAIAGVSGGGSHYTYHDQQGNRYLDDGTPVSAQPPTSSGPSQTDYTDQDTKTLLDMMSHPGGEDIAQRATDVMGGEAAIPHMADKNAVQKYLAEKVATSQLLGKRFQYVSPGEATSLGTDPGWHSPDWSHEDIKGTPTKDEMAAALANADDKRLLDAKEAAKVYNDRQKLVTARGQEEAKARKMRMSGVDPTTAELLAGGNSGDLDQAMILGQWFGPQAASDAIRAKLQGQIEHDKIGAEERMGTAHNSSAEKIAQTEALAHVEAAKEGNKNPLVQIGNLLPGAQGQEAVLRAAGVPEMEIQDKRLGLTPEQSQQLDTLYKTGRKTGWGTSYLGYIAPWNWGNTNRATDDFAEEAKKKFPDIPEQTIRAWHLIHYQGHG